MAYPQSIDNDTELIEGVSPLVVAEVNAIRDSIIAIERELGLIPSGTFGTMVDRLATMGVGEVLASNVFTDPDGYLGGASVETVLRDLAIDTERLRQKFVFNAIDAVSDKSYNVILDCPNSGRIESIAIETDSGTCDASITIDGYELDTVSVSSVRQVLYYIAANEFSPASEILITVSGSFETYMLKYLIGYSSL